MMTMISQPALAAQMSRTPSHRLDRRATSVRTPNVDEIDHLVHQLDLLDAAQVAVADLADACRRLRTMRVLEKEPTAILQCSPFEAMLQCSQFEAVRVQSATVLRYVADAYRQALCAGAAGRLSRGPVATVVDYLTWPVDRALHTGDMADVLVLSAFGVGRQSLRSLWLRCSVEIFPLGALPPHASSGGSCVLPPQPGDHAYAVHRYDKHFPARLVHCSFAFPLPSSVRRGVIAPPGLLTDPRSLLRGIVLGHKDDRRRFRLRKVCLWASDMTRDLTNLRLGSAKNQDLGSRFVTSPSADLSLLLQPAFPAADLSSTTKAIFGLPVCLCLCLCVPATTAIGCRARW